MLQCIMSRSRSQISLDVAWRVNGDYQRGQLLEHHCSDAHMQAHMQQKPPKWAIVFAVILAKEGAVRGGVEV